MKIHFKIQTWEIVTIPDDKLKDTIAGIQSGRIKDSQDLYEDLNRDEQINDYDRQYNFESDEQLTPEDNEGYSTIEVYDEYGYLLYWNGRNPLEYIEYGTEDNEKTQ